jgi:ABC-type uncharacterized transport system substrate-binding protein
MRRIGLAVVIGLALLATPLGAGSQLAGQKVPRIGYLDGASLSVNSVRIEAFRHGLRELGYVEGQSVAFEWRSADGRADRLPGLAAELVRLKVDVIVTGGSGATAPAKEATATIPIVMASDSDPVESGFVTSLARPGGNVTGLSTSSWAGNARGLRETERAAETLRLKLQYVDVSRPTDFEIAFRAASKGQAEAIVMLVWNPLLNARRKEVVELAVKSGLPTMYRERESVEVGGLITYGPNIPDLFRRAATYVDKILKGAKPGELPIEQPTKFELVINLKTAKALGLTIPQSVLLRADQVIE